MQNLKLIPGSTLSRGLALLALPLLLILLWLGFVRPIVDWASGHGALPDARQRLADQQRLAERKQALQIQKSAMEAGPKDFSDFLTGTNPALAAANMQSNVSGLIRALGGTVLSVETISLPDQEGFHRAGLRLKLTLAENVLPPLLYTLESGQPRLFIAALSLKSGKEGEIAAVMDLYGFLAQEPS